jgi:hypothetical protein
MASTPRPSPRNRPCADCWRARDSQGQRLADLGRGTLEGLPVSYVAGGAFDATTLAGTDDFTLTV